MQDTAKYLIHANIAADGVVERSDVVGAIFGQTEGLLGDELDLRDLQDSSKVGRIDVDVRSEHGQSFGEFTIATSLDDVETAILAAALETIDRVGPCKSTIEVERVEDVRAAKRREIVERATQLLHESFEGSVFSSEELIDQVREAMRVEDVTEYEGYPAGPRVADSDAVIVVEGRADVLQLLKYDVKNAVAVEGTNVPEPIAELTADRTVTAFLDGDRGGDLILKELAQVGTVDYVAFAPPGRSVEDLDRHEVMAALRKKVPYEVAAEADDPHAIAATDGSATPAPDGDADGPAPTPADEPSTGPDDRAVDRELTDAVDEPDAGASADTAGSADEAADDSPGPDDPDEVQGEPAAGEPDTEATDEDSDGGAGGEETAEDEGVSKPETLRGHVREVVHEGSGLVRLLSPDFRTLAEADADDAFETLRDAEAVPAVVVLDGEASQRVLDVAAQRGIDQVVAAAEGDFVKLPTGVRLRTADQLLSPDE
jgi:hypothetical protein